MAEVKKAEEEGLKKLLEISLWIIITVMRFSVAFVLYNGIIVSMFGTPPVTVWQAVGIWLFVKMVFGFK